MYFPLHGKVMKQRINDIRSLICYDIEEKPHFYLNDFVEGNTRERKHTNRLLRQQTCNAKLLSVGVSPFGSIYL